jgi:hypothetical protein
MTTYAPMDTQYPPTVVSRTTSMCPYFQSRIPHRLSGKYHRLHPKQWLHAAAHPIFPT